MTAPGAPHPEPIAGTFDDLVVYLLSRLGDKVRVTAPPKGAIGPMVLADGHLHLADQQLPDEVIFRVTGSTERSLRLNPSIVSAVFLREAGATFSILTIPFAIEFGGGSG
ncbi:MAG: hypothetical protein QOJ29_3627 [Thermoleophilaceae bacterium]|jgi:hypothetical protein|nr:hypothetical protein [Thermoleophilaceae bacterium]